MLSYHYRLHCTTPAFLGNAEQSGQWRTPPIKALLRQWWRVAYVADQTRPVSVDAMRAAEGRLFGTASDDREGGSSKSLVRIRLEDWGAGKLTNWQELDLHKVAHPEFKRQGKVVPIGAQLYLGYGPLDSQGGGTVLKKANAAIQANQSTELRLACLDNLEAPRLRHALWLIQQYGTLGGRSRNGWGSLVLTPVEQTPAFDAQLDPRACMPWRDALQADWPRAIGSDEQGPLIWQTEARQDWMTVMRRLAEIKIALRTHFKFPVEKPPHRQPQERHWLSYPVTHHGTSAWGRDFRLPNSLRFKVREIAPGQLRGVIVHLPCLPPPAFKPDRRAIESVWQQVHQLLDAPSYGLQRCSA